MYVESSDDAATVRTLASRQCGLGLISGQCHECFLVLRGFSPGFSGLPPPLSYISDENVWTTYEDADKEMVRWKLY